MELTRARLCVERNRTLQRYHKATSTYDVKTGCYLTMVHASGHPREWEGGDITHTRTRARARRLAHSSVLASDALSAAGSCRGAPGTKGTWHTQTRKHTQTHKRARSKLPRGKSRHHRDQSRHTFVRECLYLLGTGCTTPQRQRCSCPQHMGSTTRHLHC